MTLHRRAALGLIAAGLATPAPAAPTGDWRGYRYDLSAVAPDRRPVMEAYVRQQIDLIESIPMSEARKAWFRGVAIAINPALTQAGRFIGGALELGDKTSDPDNPVLLHEMLHGYQFAVLRPSGRNAEVLAAYEAAKRSGRWPKRAYMLSNPAEFFAMTCSVALWGQAARPPRTRQNLKARAPGWYAWIARDFELKV
jgi:hypothetical protein